MPWVSFTDFSKELVVVLWPIKRPNSFLWKNDDIIILCSGAPNWWPYSLRWIRGRKLHITTPHAVRCTRAVVDAIVGVFWSNSNIWPIHKPQLQIKGLLLGIKVGKIKGLDDGYIWLNQFWNFQLGHTKFIRFWHECLKRGWGKF